MKIEKIEFNKATGILTVYTNVFPNLGFGFNIEDIVNKNDLLAKIKARLNIEAARIQTEQDNEAKFNQLKALEGQEL